MFVFISTMALVPWGGSENLWHGAAKRLLARGVAVQTQTAQWPCVPRALEDLSTSGAVVTFRDSRAPFALRILRRLSSAAFHSKWEHRKWENRTRDWISSMPSPKVIISCGSLLDDFSQLVFMSEGRTPYAVIVHSAGPEIWPDDGQLGVVCKLLINARRVFFVSHHNLEDVQQCLDMELPNAEVIWSPVNRGSILRAMNVTLPNVREGSLKLACVARLNVHAKGQDVLLKTLALKKWKARDVSLTLFGEGPHRQVLHNLARYLGLERVSFAGQVDDILSVWDRHNLGVLASRYEGLSLAVMEAMMLGRPNVVTRAGGNSEVVEDNQTGFIANAVTVEAFDEALERAWQRRSELSSMGALAAHRIRELTPEDACLDFAERLLVVFS
jgi:glycosyltransferase involved in cell wall biosynthesis